MSARDDRRKDAYRNAQRADNARKEAEAAVDRAAPADVPEAMARVIRARSHAHAAAMRYRNMRPQKVLDTLSM